MSTVRTASLRIPLDFAPDHLALVFGRRTGAAILESGPGFLGSGRWSIYAAEPRLSFRANSEGWWFDHHRHGITDPLSVLSDLLREHGLADSCEEPGPDDPPFQGGLIGYFGYDLAPRLERLPRRARPDSRLDDLAFALYDKAVCVDGETGQVWLCGWDLDQQGQASHDRALTRFAKSLTRRITDIARKPEQCAKMMRSSRLSTPVRSVLTREDYLAAVARAKDYIVAGDIFQVNLSQRFEAQGQFDPLDLYFKLSKHSPAPFAAYLGIHGSEALVSASPESFYQTRGSQIITRPIKGTRPRGATPEDDAQLAAELQVSVKDRAELTMIVDLERNDLGRVCRYGSVKVTEPLTIESYAQVHHLVATVQGRLRPEVGPIDVVRAMFPGGSITGAPKIRAMEIIDELEPTRRSAYTGAIGYFSRGGSSAFNIAIRTMLVEGDRVTYQVGGAIVADSEPENEYEETLHKGRAMREVLEGLERSE
ncbi:MAG: pabB [Planctomycetota bacterium]|nr:pabB [Planctomycetota bacterium]